MLVDTLSFTECVRRRYACERFSDQFYLQASHAALWLLDITDPISGDAPNIGTNDGSMLFNCSSYSFRDFRPSVQLSLRLFCSQHVYSQHTHPLFIIFEKVLSTTLEDQLGIATRPAAEIFKRVGNGQNIVRDAGTYSYNPPAQFTEDLGSTAHHSTVQIDSRDQMPKLSRFLYGAWLYNSERNSKSADNDVQVLGGYKDWQGASHIRSVSKTSYGFKVDDDVAGVLEQATLRWRLAYANWTLDDVALTSDLATLRWESNQDLQVRLVESVESRFYLQLDPVVVLELSAAGPVSFTTHIDFH